MDATQMMVFTQASDAGSRLQLKHPVEQERIDEFLLLLQTYDSNDPRQVNRLSELIYPDLRRVAAALLRREYRIGESMQPTILASDSIMRLIVNSRVEPKDFPHFLSIAAGAMRQLLVDHIRRKRAKRRPSSGQRAELEDNFAIPPEMEDDVMALHEGLDRLGAEYQMVLEMHYFSDATVEDIAAHLGMSERTVKRRLDAARLRLRMLLTTKGALK